MASTLSGAPGATSRVLAEMTPPKASEPYATEPGPRETSTPPRTKGSRYKAPGPARRSELARAPSIRIRLRPFARPRMAGTEVCAGAVRETPATFSRVSARLAGWRDSMSAFGTIVVPLAGGDSIEGAAPAVTLTLSSTIGRTAIATSPSAGTAVTRKGFMYWPPGSTISTSNGATGSGATGIGRRLSVRCVPVKPSTETSAPAMGAPVASITTRP